MNITIRNIPDQVVNKIRALAKRERRSLNNEILMILEKGLDEKLGRLFDFHSNLSKDLQVDIWKNLSLKWQDDRSSDEIIKDIYQHRTMGREVEL
ncbi:Arc family DNA-binding protein [candidate division KSB1 bacterium]|nr:Arc family DNA-binding protein [candidate division KSB1 bacterium]